ncbi:MAG: S-(hydroxymethyl)glutathione dehydrogenase / alcohol dehydrogenase [Gaiellaceae bacterium]|nr:S-(hydroxymethyl)glutathione dehydrogenase / alcohol dehydrogenase [Gaiellaceae bacterium]
MPEITAAVWNGGGQPLQLERLRLVDPGEREVRVRMAAAGVCHSDYHVVKGEWARRSPSVLGHEGAGIVEEIGPGVTTLEVGDHVVLSWKPHCGTCVQCLRGRYVLCELANATNNLLGDGRPRLWRGDEPVSAMGGLGTFAEQSVVPETGAIRIDRSLPLDVAALVGCAVTTGVGSVLNTARVEPGSTVLVVGCGGVGLSAILGAVLVSASQIIAVDVVESKLELARQLGATHTFDATGVRIPDEVRKLTGGRGVRYAFEAIGRADTIEAAYESLDDGGTMTIVGQVPDGVRISIDPYEMSDREKTLTGSNYGSARPALDFPRLLDWYAAGQLNLDPLVARRISLGDVNEAFAELATGRATRSVIVFDP